MTWQFDGLNMGQFLYIDGEIGLGAATGVGIAVGYSNAGK